MSGVIWRGLWLAEQTYQVNQVVTYEGASYIATSINTNTPTDATSWKLYNTPNAGISGVIDWRGTWRSGSFYSPLDAVQYKGTSYIATQTSQGQSPDTNPGVWDVLAMGLNSSLIGPPGNPGHQGIPGNDGADGQGLIWRNLWDSEATYNAYDCVGFNGSSYICIADTVLGIAPTSDTTKWNLLAAEGSGAGGSTLLETNGTSNGSQTLFNLVAGSNITLTDSGTGAITISSSGTGGGSIQVNSDWNATSGVSEIVNKPTLAPVAISGSYSDLHGLPTIPAPQVQSDWNETVTTAPDFIKNKPVIPTSTSQLVNNSGFIASSGAPVQSVAGRTGAVVLAESDIANLTTNLAATEKTANKGVAYGYAALDSTGKVPSQQLPTMGSGNATSIAGIVVSETSVPDGSVLTYVAANNDIEFKPVPPEQVNSDWNASTGLAQILNKPSIPTETSQLTNNSGFIAASGAPVQSVNGQVGVVSIAIPAAQVPSDWNSATGITQILNKPTLGTAASQPSSAFDVAGAAAAVQTSVTASLSAETTRAENAEAILVPKSTTVNGHMLNSNVVISASDITTGMISLGLLPVIPYSSLSGLPTIPAPQVQADWNESVATNLGYIKNKPTIPSQTAQLTNNSGFITSAGAPVQSIAGKTGVVTLGEGDIADLTSDLASKANVSSLATVATSGSYTDLINTPTTIVTSVAGRVGAVTITEGDVANLTTDLAATEKTTNKGVANGYPSLDSTNHIPLSQLPTSVQGAMSYTGVWNALTNTPAIASGVGTKGAFYKVSVAGSTTVDGNSTWHVGDMVIFDGTVWDKVDNYEAVTSVAGRTGAVVLAESDITGLVNDLDAKANSASLATVAASGSYTDLVNQPSIPAAQVNADWNAVTGVATVLNKPTLAASATTDTTNAGNISSGTLSVNRLPTSGIPYSSLSGTPTIPTTTSQLTNNSGFITSSGAPVQTVAGRTGAVVLAEGDITNLTADLATKVGTATTVNGHPLSSNIVVSASDLTTGTLPHAQLPTLLAGDIPALAYDATGAAAAVQTNLTIEVVRAEAAEGLLVAKTVTVNGHALSSNITVAYSDLTGLPTIPVVGTTPPLVSGVATIGATGKWADAGHVHPASIQTLPIKLTSVSYSILTTDGLVLCTAGAGGITITLPDATIYTGRTFYIKQTDTGTGGVAIATTSSQTIDTLSSYQLLNQNQFVQVVSDGSNWQVIGAN